MWFESQEGVGTTFYLKFTTACEESKCQANLLEGKRLLILDSSESLCKSLEKWLHHWKMRVQTWRTLDYNSKLPLHDLDVILCDCKFMDQLRGQLKGNVYKVPVIVMEYLKSQRPYSIVISKPIRIRKLYDKICRALKIHTKTPPTRKCEVTKHPARILIAEDNYMNQRIILGLLQKIGYVK